MAQDDPRELGLSEKRAVREALGQSEAFDAFQESLSLVAPVDRPVLLIGERGTGKELAAARLHFLSSRWQEPYVALNCSALSANVIESELFGHEVGAFTGAAKRRKGRFEAAHGGTLFLDEIGNIPVETQEKILRAVEYGTFERVGASDPVEVDVRIIGATNANLEALVDEGRFMRDLLDRLSFEVLFIPPLRARSDDIMLLARHFANEMSIELGWPGLPIYTDDAIEKLEAYGWPGNVRELKNVIERAVYRSDDDIITGEECVFDPFHSPYAPLPGRKAPSTQPGTPPPSSATPKYDVQSDLSFDEAVSALEIRLMRRALERAKFNQRKAADDLGLTYHQFRGLYRKYGDELKE